MPHVAAATMVLVNHALYSQIQDVLVLLLEIFVGLASFTGCLVAVDKLYLFYATVFYKVMALLRPNDWEPTLRYPRKWKRGVKPPTVCVQLPMFNETYVARRAIDYTCKMDYPKECLYIQILDDSTDPETRDVVDAGVAYWREQGIHIEAIRRTNRQGYKAGAMHEVHEAIPCDFIGIFDADFLPVKDFLMRAIPVFQDKNVGFVQGRWTYVNADESLFCRYQVRASTLRAAQIPPAAAGHTTRARAPRHVANGTPCVPSPLCRKSASMRTSRASSTRASPRATS